MSIFGLSLYKLTFTAVSIESLQTDLMNGLEQALTYNSVIFLEATIKINRMIFTNHTINIPSIAIKSDVTYRLKML